jgi:hypothetical protein
MRTIPLIGIALCSLFRTVSSQAHASLGIGVSTVRYAGSSSSAPSLSPALRFSSPRLHSEFSGILASIADGEWSTLGRGMLWVATPAIVNGLHIGGEGNVAGTTHTGGPWTAAAHGLGELFWAGSCGGFGLGAGPSAGWIESQPSVTALHTRARAWARVGRVDVALSVEPTRFLGAWFTDASAGLSVEAGSLVASAWGLARLSDHYGSKAAVSGSLQFFMTPHLALELSGGSYLPDPYQGLPRARYVAAGLRLHSGRRTPRAPPAPRWPPLVPGWRGDSVLLQFRMPGATSVALAGDWNEWQPLPLTSSGGEVWEGALTLAPGIYRFVLLVDGKDWVVPAGVATAADGMGGKTAMLVVTRP